MLENLVRFRSAVQPHLDAVMAERESQRLLMDCCYTDMAWQIPLEIGPWRKEFIPGQNPETLESLEEVPFSTEEELQLLVADHLSRSMENRPNRVTIGSEFSSEVLIRI